MLTTAQIVGAYNATVATGHPDPAAFICLLVERSRQARCTMADRAFRSYVEEYAYEKSVRELYLANDGLLCIGYG